MVGSSQKQRGAVSLFIVIFAALLIVTIVTAFVRIMVQDQQQATTSDLAKSAMDSAQAGVEDAKRALVEYYKEDCPRQDTSHTRCNQLKSALLDRIDSEGWTLDCDTTSRAGVVTMTNDEVPVQTNNDDSSLNQAYTCVKVQMNPETYVGNDTSQLLRLKTKDNAPFTKIKIQWYVQQDNTPLNLDDGTVSNYELLDSWPAKRPQILRLQLLQYGTDFALTDFDSNYQNNSTLFLLPTSIPGLNTGTFASDFRKSKDSQSTQKVGCTQAPDRGAYACEMTLDLPDVGAASRNAYLKVDQLYASGNKLFSVTMLDSTDTPVRFSDVQVVVDSTGRANDIFKRIRSRVDVGGGVPTPDAAVDVSRSLCKEFMVTDTAAYPGKHGSECPLPPVTP